MDALSSIDCVTDTLAPCRTVVDTVRGHQIERRIPWLGPLVLARWATDDPHTWHDVNDLPDVSCILGGWLPATVSDRAVRVMLDTIQSLESKGQVPGRAPCQPGDVVRFTYLAFWRIVARCVWVDPGGMIGVRVGILGYDHVIPVPWAAVEGWEDRILAPRYRAKNRFTNAPL